MVSRDSNRSPDLAPEFLADRPHVGRGRIGVQLGDVETRLFRSARDFIRIVGSKNADPPYLVARRVEDLATLARRNSAWSFRENDSDIARTNFGGERGILRARHAAKLNFCEHRESAG